MPCLEGLVRRSREPRRSPGGHCPASGHGGQPWCASLWVCGLRFRSLAQMYAGSQKSRCRKERRDKRDNGGSDRIPSKAGSSHHLVPNMAAHLAAESADRRRRGCSRPLSLPTIIPWYATPCTALRGGFQGARIGFAGSLAETKVASTQRRKTDLCWCSISTCRDAGSWPGLAALRAAHPALPIAIVSASTNSAAMRQAVEMGAAGLHPEACRGRPVSGCGAGAFLGGAYLAAGRSAGTMRWPRATAILHNARPI